MEWLFPKFWWSPAKCLFILEEKVYIWDGFVREVELHHDSMLCWRSIQNWISSAGHWPLPLCHIQLRHWRLVLLSDNWCSQRDDSYRLLLKTEHRHNFSAFTRLQHTPLRVRNQCQGCSPSPGRPSDVKVTSHAAQVSTGIMERPEMNYSLMVVMATKWINCSSLSTGKQ